jgi:hypothetical protein
VSMSLSLSLITADYCSVSVAFLPTITGVCC